MKSMFEMGFTQDLFGSRLSSPMLGQVPIRGMGQARSMGQLTTKEDGDLLLRQMTAAENQVTAANAFVSSHPNLQAALGTEYDSFQHNMSVIADAASAETNVSMALQSTPPGGQYQINESDHQAVTDFIAAAAAVTASIARSGNKAGTLPGTAPKTVVTAPKSDLTTPLLVGGGILTIGLVALLARA